VKLKDHQLALQAKEPPEKPRATPFYPSVFVKHLNRNPAFNLCFVLQKHKNSLRHGCRCYFALVEVFTS
jgi:hypothetical protein